MRKMLAAIIILGLLFSFGCINQNTTPPTKDNYPETTPIINKTKPSTSQDAIPAASGGISSSGEEFPPPPPSD